MSHRKDNEVSSWTTNGDENAISAGKDSTRLNVNVPSILGSSSVANQKILKFFGVESSSAARTPSEERALWFVRRGYQPTDVTLNMENQLTGGTWEALVEMLTPHDSTVGMFINIFNEANV